MIHVLFVCLGNICRSPMAELIFKKLVQERGVRDRFSIDSCATSGYEVGNAVYPPALRVLRAHGVEGNHTARRITPLDLAQNDYVLVMDEENLRAVNRLAQANERGKIRKLCSFTDRPRDVADPWYTGDFERAYADIREGCAAFLDFVLED